MRGSVGRERLPKDRSARMGGTGLIKRSIYPPNVSLLSGPSYYSPLSSGDKNVPLYVISSFKLMLLHFRNKSWKVLRRRAGGWRRPRVVNGSAEPPPCVKLVVTSDAVFPVRAGAECGAVQKRLPDPEGGESVQTERAETGKNLDPGLRFPPRCASVMLVLYI